MITQQFQSRLAIKAKQRFGKAQSDSQSEQGLTLIECIVALVVIALTVGSVTPALVIAVATRVQSQKAEQAIKVAQAEIDTIRTLMERGGYDANSVPAIATPALSDDPADANSIDSHLGPLSGVTQPATVDYATLGANQVREVDVDGDNEADFGIQVYRSEGQDDTNGIPVAFTMGVRVYDINAVNAGGAAPNLDTEEARAGTTGGQGERSRRPLAVIYTVMAKGDLDAAYCDYLRFLEDDPTDPASDYNALGCI